ncbi:hypothetical protein [Novosphingobium sp.]|uniref:hypothetical protein n=1 Tax=Novosphingobium sp. TaxID=1874826 RepID=UPI00286BF1A7|nr:hypothetical protein [Novosphingobium sp.]
MANGQGPQGRECKTDAAGETVQGGARQFVNHIEFFLSLSDVKFDLGSLGAAPRPGPAVWRFVTTPHHLRRLHCGMSRALASYEQRFGSIEPAEGSSDG